MKIVLADSEAYNAGPVGSEGFVSDIFIGVLLKTSGYHLFCVNIRAIQLYSISP